MSNPTLGVWEFEVDLDGDTPSGPVSFVGVDPIRFDDGLWLEEATTNLCRNPSFESGTTVWSANNGTLSQDAGAAYVGSASLLTIRSSATGNLGPFFTTSNGTIAEGDYVVVTLAAKADYAPTTCVLEVYWRTDASGALGYAATTQFALTAGFVEHTYVFGPAPATVGKVIVGLTDQSNGTIGEKLWIDAVQVEKKRYATSYADYTMGAGYGGSLGSASTRAASSASVATGILSPASGAIAFRVTPTIETGVEELWGEAGVKGAATDHVRWGRDATKHPFIEWSSNDAAYQRLTASETIDAGVETFLYFGHAGTATSLQVDSGTLQTGSRAAVSASFGAGALTLRASSGGNIVSPFATYDQPLDAGYRGMVRDEIAAGGANLWNLLNADGSLSGSMELSHPLSARFALDALLPGTLDLS